MTTLQIAAYADLSGEDLSGVTGLEFTEDNSFMFLSSAQAADQLAANLSVDGGGHSLQIIIGSGSGGSVDLSSWSFTQWAAVSHISIFQVSAVETLIGSSVSDRISVGQGDIADGGSGDDIFFVAGGATISGGGGDDEMHFFRPGGGGTIDGGDGVDRLGGLRLGLPYDAVVDFRDGGSHFTGFKGWSFANVEALGINTRGGEDRVIGGAGDDFVDGGADSDVIDGQRGNDLLDGGKGEDIIRGGLGEDRLFGGTEADVFVYMRPAEGRDAIVDFGFGETMDSFRISAEGFGLDAGPLDAAALQVAAAAEALTAEARIVYDSSTGRLSFDIDGDGGKNAVLLAILPTALALTTSQFEIV